jgi:hypothetical protein
MMSKEARAMFLAGDEGALEAWKVCRRGDRGGGRGALPGRPSSPARALPSLPKPARSPCH